MPYKHPKKGTIQTIYTPMTPLGINEDISDIHESAQKNQTAKNTLQKIAP
jgi:hypothetical protein